MGVEAYIMLSIITYSVGAGATGKLLWNVNPLRGETKGYPSKPCEWHDSPLVIFGAWFWPVTLGVLSGVGIANVCSPKWHRQRQLEAKEEKAERLRGLKKKNAQLDREIQQLLED